MGTDICWNGVFKQPSTEKEDHSGYLTTVDLATLEGFDYKLEECQEYEIRLRPIVTNQHGNVWSGPEILKPFTLIDKLQPPKSMNISNITNISFLVSWKTNQCTNTKEVEIVISKNGSIVMEYRPPAHSREHMFTQLESCTDYLVQVYSLEGGFRSEDAQMMVVITRPDENLPLSLESHSNSIHIFNEANISKCIQVNIVAYCK